ncbi:MAG: hypothetical protein V5A62_16270 [Haloarculaceae archaeon]
MSSEATVPNETPNQTDAIPDTYAIYVDDEQIHLWQYRVEVFEPDGQWYFVETLDRDNDPELSLEYATPMAPTAGGYWIYSRSYDCELDCE